MTAEQIVRALAALDPDYHTTGMWHGCGLCEAALPVYVTDHKPDCPWRLAVEWVAQQDVVDHCQVCGASPTGRCDPPDEYDGECPHGCSPEH